MTTLISAINLDLAFGDVPLLANTSFAILEKQKIGLVGRNGCGKSSLLKVLAGFISVDGGEITQQTGMRISYIAQEQYFSEATVYEVLQKGLAEVHDSQAWADDSKIKTWAGWIGLDIEKPIGELSGGEKKRLGIAQGLISEPNLILLDEPTNHLDIASILWLEKTLRKSSVAMVIISHDRHFLNQVSTLIMELDRANIQTFEGNFEYYQLKKEELLVQEAVQRAKFDKLLSQEEVWIRQGVQARRTRAQARIERLEQMRNTKEQQRKQMGAVRFNLAQAELSGKVVAELENVSLNFGDRPILKDFSLRVARGDKIGIIGPNGIGKTSLVKVILGLLPAQGFLKLGMNLEIAYFDQMREQLDPNKTLADTISPGSEWLMINKQRKHIMAYLADFLFSSKRANSPVGSLSGGERNRLLLARLFAKPSNVLILDEPSNDLDIPTLELLEEKLIDYPGTVFLISHDRSFMNQVVDCVIAPTPVKAEWKMYVGNYDDWLRQTNQTQNAELLIELSNLQQLKSKTKNVNKNINKNNDKNNDKNIKNINEENINKNIDINNINVNNIKNNIKKVSKLSFQQKKRLSELPNLIQNLELEQKKVQEALAKAYTEHSSDAHLLAEQDFKLEQTMFAMLEEWETLGAAAV